MSTSKQHYVKTKYAYPGIAIPCEPDDGYLSMAHLAEELKPYLFENIKCQADLERLHTWQRELCQTLNIPEGSDIINELVQREDTHNKVVTELSVLKLKLRGLSSK